MYILIIIIHVLMRDNEGRKKEARSNKQQGKATQHTQGSMYMYMSETALGVLCCFALLFV